VFAQASLSVGAGRSTVSPYLARRFERYGEVAATGASQDHRPRVQRGVYDAALVGVDRWVLAVVHVDGFHPRGSFLEAGGDEQAVIGREDEDGPSGCHALRVPG
jgi:hypothetical protein